MIFCICRHLSNLGIFIWCESGFNSEWICLHQQFLKNVLSCVFWKILGHIFNEKSGYVFNELVSKSLKCHSLNPHTISHNSKFPNPHNFPHLFKFTSPSLKLHCYPSIHTHVISELCLSCLIPSHSNFLLNFEMRVSVCSLSILREI